MYSSKLNLPRLGISLICFFALYQVGDGLEMYVILARGHGAQGLLNVPGAQEISQTDDGERVFVVRRELKKD